MSSSEPNLKACLEGWKQRQAQISVKNKGGKGSHKAQVSSQPEPKKKAARPRAKKAKDTPKKPPQRRVTGNENPNCLRNGSIKTKNGGRSPARSLRAGSEIPISKRLKDVVLCLREYRTPMSPSDVTSRCKVQMDDPVLLEKVRCNERVDVLPDGRFLYRPLLTNVRDRSQLMHHVSRHPTGTWWADLSDAYPVVEKHLEELKEEGRLFVLWNPEKEDRVVYPNDPTLKHVSVSPDVLALWGDIKIEEKPSELASALKAAKLTPAKRKGIVQRAQIQKPPKSRKKRDFKFRKITNVHLLGEPIFMSEQPEQID